MKNRLNHKTEPYCGKKELNKLCHKARATYKDQVVNQKKNYDRFAKDFINVHFHHDADDAHSKNLHNLNIGMIEDLLLNNRALAEYSFNQQEFTDNSIEQMIDMMNGMMPMPPSLLQTDRYLENGFNLDLPAAIPPVLNFECLFDNYKLELITRIANEVHVFTDEVKTHDMKELFNCIPRKPQPLMARDIVLLALFFQSLHYCKHITAKWQKVIAEHKLIVSHKTKKPLKQGNLSTAIYDCRYRELESVETKIMALVEQIPKNRRNIRL
ncbi:MAG: hypothetical protein PHO36_13420 [Parabacteroides sp.]|nr:hypothetical protein [Parabacteroides sp.]